MNKKLILNNLLFNGGQGSGNFAPGEGKGVGKPYSDGTTKSSKSSKSSKKTTRKKKDTFVNPFGPRSYDDLTKGEIDAVERVMKGYINDDFKYAVITGNKTSAERRSKKYAEELLKGLKNRNFDIVDVKISFEKMFSEGCATATIIDSKGKKKKIDLPRS